MKSIQKTARTAGFLYLLLAAISAFGLVYVPSILIALGDAATTIRSIQANENLFRIGIVSNLIAFTLNIFVVALLYKILKPVDKGIASLMVIFILLGIGIAMLNEMNQVAALLLSRGSEAVITAQSLALVPFYLDLYQHGFVMAHIFFGLWLLPMGYLILKSTFLPKFLGVFLIIACIGYIIDFIIFFLFPSVDLKLSVFTFVGELFLLLWLLIKGVNVREWEKTNDKKLHKKV